MKATWTQKLIGATLGMAIAGYFVIYLPMARNYDQCGKVTLCNPPNPGKALR